MRSGPRRTSARVLVPLSVVTGVVGGLLFATGVTAQSLDRSFVAVAEANGMLVRYGIPGFLAADNYIDGGGPSSQAVVADGAAGSYASLPYPGSAGVGYPGLVNFVTGQTPPSYPFYVSASHPTQPDQSLRDPSGAYSLQATAKDGQAKGDARMVPPGSGADAVPITQAASDVVREGDVVTATGRSLADGLALGPLTIGRVRSQSVTTWRRGADQPTTTTELAIEGGRANDLVFSFGREGFQFAQNGIPLPAGQGLGALNQALAPTGMSVRFDEPTRLNGGAVAAAFEITHVADVPSAGKGTFTIRFGGASSFITLAAPGADAAEGILPPPPYQPPPADAAGVEPGVPASPVGNAATGGGPTTGPPVALTGSAAASFGQPTSFGGTAAGGATGVAGSAAAATGLPAEATAAPGAAAPAPGDAVLALPARLAVGQRHVGALSVVGAVLMAASVLCLALVALATRRSASWTG
jgi:hypothetical protein